MFIACRGSRTVAVFRYVLSLKVIVQNNLYCTFSFADFGTNLYALYLAETCEITCIFDILAGS